MDTPNTNPVDADEVVTPVEPVVETTETPAEESVESATEEKSA